MRHKILELKNIRINNIENCEAVALNIVREDAGDFVRLSAWHEIDDEMFYQVEEIRLPSFKMCERFIEDFTVESAVIFAKNFDHLNHQNKNTKNHPQIIE